MANNTTGYISPVASNIPLISLLETTANKALTGLVAGFTLDGQTPADGSYVGLMAQTGGTGNGLYLYTIDGANYTLTLVMDLSTASTIKSALILPISTSAGNNSGLTYKWFVKPDDTIYFATVETPGSNQVTKSYASAPTDISSNATVSVTITFAPDVWTSIVEKTIRVYLDGGTTPSPLVVTACDTTETADNLTQIRLSVTNLGVADKTGVIVRVGVTGVAG